MIPSVLRADCVVLVHGLARTEASMTLMAAAFRARGDVVVTPSYPSTKAPVERLSAALPRAMHDCGATRPVHFVTHSMGGILLRHWLQAEVPEGIGRVVMLGPPNQGSELVDKMAHLAPFQWINGPAGLQLGTDAQALPKRLGPVPIEVGVIAGRATVSPVYSWMIPGVDDGKVSVASTRVSGMADHITLPVTHTYMMANPKVIAQAQAFLDHGRFDRSMTWWRALGWISRPGRGGG